MGREQILSVATSLFAASGYAGTPTSLIAERAKVAHGTVFHHFKTKERLLIEIGETLIQRYIDGLQQVAAEAGTGWERLERALRYHFAFVSDNADGVYVVVAEYPRVLHRSRNEEHFQDVGRMVEQVNTIRRRMLEQGQADGSIVPIPVSSTVFLIDSLLSGIVHAQVGQHVPVPENLGAACVDFLRRSLRTNEP